MDLVGRDAGQLDHRLPQGRIGQGRAEVPVEPCGAPGPLQEFHRVDVGEVADELEIEPRSGNDDPARLIPSAEARARHDRHDPPRQVQRGKQTAEPFVALGVDVGGEVVPRPRTPRACRTGGPAAAARRAGSSRR